MDYKDRSIIGLVEEVAILGSNQQKVVRARIDTGATKSSIDNALAKELGLGEIVGKRLVKSAHGSTIRSVVKAKIKLAGQTFESEFTIANRSHMKYRILVGQNILRRGYLIDPSK
jgi:hypothetical protein